ncbi:DUF481 domain-containing protein [Agaribacterium sp. ZY112]|uniref:DUF481 domain-containing protein n=1 Tax=Agaribacterium sp. ZY112 TaxID=3233574 RepID=UPI0035261384
MFVRNLFSVLLISLCFSSPVWAQQQVPNFVSDAVAKDQHVAPPARLWDWLQLTSGEWLKGDFKVLYSDEMEFDSDELGLLTIELEDIAYMQSGRPQAIRVTSQKEKVVGLIVLDGGKLEVTSNGQTRSFTRDDIIAMVSAQPEKRNYWKVRLSLGANIRAGNSPNTEYNGKFNAQRRTTLSRLSFDYLGTYSSVDGVETANNQRVNSSFDIFATDSMFYRPFFMDVLSDPFQNLDARGTLGAGIGWTAINNGETELDIVGGPGLQFTEYSEVEEGENKKESSLGLILTTDFSTELTSELDFDYLYHIQVNDDASGGYTHHMVTTLEYELNDAIDLEVSYVWDYTQYPKANEAGEVPENDDYRLMFSIGYEFN